MMLAEEEDRSQDLAGNLHGNCRALPMPSQLNTGLSHMSQEPLSVDTLFRE